MARQVGTSGQAVRLDPRNRVPERERNLCRRAPELAAAETDAQASRDQEHRGWPVDQKTVHGYWLRANGIGNMADASHHRPYAISRQRSAIDREREDTHEANAHCP